MEVILVPDQTAETCATIILNKFIARWGCSLATLNDQGRNYVSKFFSELYKSAQPKVQWSDPDVQSDLDPDDKAYLCGEQEDLSSLTRDHNLPG